MYPGEKLQLFYADAIEKLAAAKKDDRIPVGLKEMNRASMRATRMGSKGMQRYIVNPKTLHARQMGQLKGMGIGTPAGVALGTALGALLRGKKGLGFGAFFGGLGGLTIGQIAGLQHGSMKDFRSRGIYPKWHGFTGKLTPEAYKKYIKAYAKGKKN